MAIVHIEGFEHGRSPNSAEVTGNGLWAAAPTSTPTVTAGSARTGSYGLEVACTGSAMSIQIPHHSNLAVTVCSFYFKMVSLPAAAVQVATQTVTVGTGWHLRIDQNGSVIIDYPATQVDTGIDVTTGTWHRVDSKFDVTGTTHTLDVMVDGQRFAQQTEASSAATAGSIRIGTGSTGNTFTVHYDDIVLASAAGDWPIGGGDVVGLTLDQSANAEHQSITTTQWQYGTVAAAVFTSTNNFASGTETDSRSRLNDMDTSDGAGAIRGNGGASGQAGNARWSLGDPSPDPGTPPSALYAVMTGQEPSTGTNNWTTRILLGANTTNLFSGDPGWGTTWNYVGAVLARPGGGAWTAQDIRDLKLEMDSTDSTPAVHIGGFYAQAAYPDRSRVQRHPTVRDLHVLTR